MTDRLVSLALETSQRTQSVAIRLAGGEILQESVDAADRSREDLLPAIERVMARAGLGPERLGAVMLNAGPGGFTGLRVAHAAAQAIAIARSIPVVQVSGADCARASAVLSGDLPDADACWVALASKGLETWIALAAPGGTAEGRSIEVGSWRPGDCRVLVADEHLPQPWLEAVASHGLRVIALRPEARAVLAAGMPMLQRGAFTPPEALVPAYPREAEAVRLWRQRHGARAG